MAKKRRPPSRKSQKRKFWNYPRRGKGPLRRWLPSWRFILGSFLLFMATGVGAFVYLYTTTEVPEPGDFALAQSTTVYYNDEESAMGTFAEVRRTSVPLETLPDYVPHAIVASEDQRFYENPGIDVIGMTRALINNIRGGATQGGSTLTQQYVERYYTGTTTSIPGKAREAVLALKIDQEQSKEEILGNYLNTIYFGRGSYGIEEAAKSYFGISASELSLDQAALLVAVIPSPSNWDPAVNEDQARSRWTRVLRRMAEDGWVTQNDVASATFPETIAPNSRNVYEGTNGYILSTVRQEIVANSTLTEEDIDTGGLTIVTTIDQRMQDAAVAAVNNLPEDRPANNQVGLVSADPRTGEVKALYGGANYLERQRNAATQDRAQAGSTAKPFALLAAIEDGIPLTTRFNSASPMVIDGTEFENFQQRGFGYVDLKYATAQSINTSFLLLNKEITPERTRETAIKAGLPEDTPALDNVLTNVLGPYSSRPIDMVRAYGTFANGGEKTTPHLVAKVIDRDGNVVYRGDTSSERVFDSGDIATLTSALEGVTAPSGTASIMSQLGRPVAGKTGTSSFLASAWFVGYIPQLVTAVDMYQVGADGSEESLTSFGGVLNISGATYPSQIWLDYMMVATEGMDVEEFPEPPTPVRPSYAPRPAPAPAPVEPVPSEESTEEPQPDQSEEPAQPEPAQPEPAQPEPEQPDPGNGEPPGQQDPPGQQNPPGNPEPPGQQPEPAPTEGG